MLQSFIGVLENGQIHWEEPNQLPSKAKVIVTVIEPIATEKTTSNLSKYVGIWKNLDTTQKESLNKHLNESRDEWERPI